MPTHIYDAHCFFTVFYQIKAKKLAFVNSVSENAYSTEIVAKELLDIVSQTEKYSEQFKSFYKVDNLTIEDIAIKRNWLRNSAEPDIERCAHYIMKDFRDGKIGKFILDSMSDIEI